MMKTTFGAAGVEVGAGARAADVEHPTHARRSTPVRTEVFVTRLPAESRCTA
jgi:hypothetical protein